MISTPDSLTELRLVGEHVRLEPATADHVEGLWAASRDGDPWRYVPHQPRNEAELRGLIAHAADLAAAGTGVALAVLRPDGTPIGATGYWAVDRAHRRVEIGATWVARAWRRTAVNTECKLLMLAHAFDVFGCVRVEFKTDALNDVSRASLRRIGAVEEGTFRAHMVMPDGRLRDSVYYSVLATEWPAVRAALEQRLVHGASGDR